MLSLRRAHTQRLRFDATMMARPSWIGWLLPSCTLAVFPAAFLGSLHLLLGLLLTAATAWLAATSPAIRWRAVFLIAILFVGQVGPSLLVCGSASGFCDSLGVELGYRELYLLAIALPMCFGGFACAGQTNPAIFRAGVAALGVYVSIGLAMLCANDDLANRIGPLHTQLFLERNDLAPLVAWIFFLYRQYGDGLSRRSAQLAVFASIVTICVLLILATQSRLIGAVALLGMAFCFPVRARWRRESALLVLVVCLLMLIDFRNLENYWQRIWLNKGGLESIQARLFLWRAGLEMSLDAPWVGHGVGSFGGAFESYRQSMHPWAGIDARITPWPHNVLIETLFDKGLVGLSAIMFLLVRTTGNLVGWSSRRVCAVSASATSASATYLFLAMLLIGLVDSSMIRLWYLPSLLFLLGLSEGIRERRRSE